MAKTKTVNLGKKGSFTEHPGALHRALGIPQGQKIGPGRIAKAEHSSDPNIRKMADSAAGFEHMHHGGDGGGKVGAAQIFTRSKLPKRPAAPESAGPDKDAEQKKKKMGASEIFGRRR